MIIDKLKSSIYLLASFISGSLEFGIIIWGLSSNLSIVSILLLAVSYQLGNLVFINNRFLLSVLSILSFLNFFYGELFITILLLSIVLQNIRRLHKSNITNFKKRIFRILGFLISPIFLYYNSIEIILLILFLIVLFSNYIIVNNNKKYFVDFQINSFDLSYLIMLIHQIHYFTYIYFIVIIIFKIHNTSIYYIGIFISVGWLTYIFMEKILINHKYYLYVITGHIFLFFILFLMSKNYSNFFIFTLLWILTGIGGGTVFGIKKIIISNNNLKNNIDLIENIGHVFGPIIGLLIYNINNNFSDVFIFSAIMSLLVSLLTAYIFIKRNSYW